MRNALIIILVAFCFFNSYAQNEKRIALVIGNAEYLHGNSLKNPVNDAELMARTLQGLNFKVIKKINATRKEMSKAIVEFSGQIKDYNAALFYYAGHGIQVDGVNYVIPVDAKIEEPLAVKFEALDVENIVSQFEYYSDRANIVILDACRDNPFLAWVRGAMNSFAPIKAPRGSFVAFSTGSGSVAMDNIKGENGLYTGILSEELLKSQRIEDVFINTRNKVYDLSKGKQQPQEWSQLSGTFFFTKENITIPENNFSKTNTDTVGNTAERSLENDFMGLRKGSFRDPDDKKKYKWVKIGKHIWMAENSQKFIDTTNSFYYKNNEKIGKELGYLYTWDGAQKACPTGWRLPDVTEWRKMVLYLGMDMKVAQHLKSDIDPYSSDFYWRWAEMATKPDNSSGFSALYSGYRTDKKKFYMSTGAGFWTSSEKDGDKGKAYFYMIPSTFDKVYYTPANKEFGFSVRCVKDI